MSVLLIPTLGPFHILHPRYNGVTVLELVKAHQPTEILLASYSPPDLAEGRWRDAGEVSLFHVCDWAESTKVPLAALDERAHLKPEAERFREALAQYPKGQQALAGAAELEQGLAWVLTNPRTPEEFSGGEVYEALRAYAAGMARLFGEGPATGFRRERMGKVAESLRPKAKGQERVAVLVDALDYPLLREFLPETLTPPPHTPTEAERQRSVLDRAWQLDEADDWAILLRQLQEVEGPEAMYCAAQIYLAAGQPDDALEVLEQLVHTEFQHPAYLPGYTLARYGQMADLAGQRDKALRAYRAALALSWAPQEAREIALAGQKTPFSLGK